MLIQQVLLLLLSSWTLVVSALPVSILSGEIRLLRKRAFSYIANETVCMVDNQVFMDGDPIPTDDPCESCKCRPPGFACVLRECDIKPGCKMIRKEGECCPQYQCGCEHNGRMYRDGERIYNIESPCYNCFCQGSSITCALAECRFRFDCKPVYIAGQCCPRYDHCDPPPLSSSSISSPPPAIESVASNDEMSNSIAEPLRNVTDAPLPVTTTLASNESTETKSLLISTEESSVTASSETVSGLPSVAVTVKDPIDATTMSSINTNSDASGSSSSTTSIATTNPTVADLTTITIEPTTVTKTSNTVDLVAFTPNATESSESIGTTLSSDQPRIDETSAPFTENSVLVTSSSESVESTTPGISTLSTHSSSTTAGTVMPADPPTSIPIAESGDSVTTLKLIQSTSAPDEIVTVVTSTLQPSTTIQESSLSSVESSSSSFSPVDEIATSTQSNGSTELPASSRVTEANVDPTSLITNSNQDNVTQLPPITIPTATNSQPELVTDNNVSINKDANTDDASGLLTSIAPITTIVLSSSTQAPQVSLETESVTNPTEIDTTTRIMFAESSLASTASSATFPTLEPQSKSTTISTTTASDEIPTTTISSQKIRNEASSSTTSTESVNMEEVTIPEVTTSSTPAASSKTNQEELTVAPTIITTVPEYVTSTSINSVTSVTTESSPDGAVSVTTITAKPDVEDIIVSTTSGLVITTESVATPSTSPSSTAQVSTDKSIDRIETIAMTSTTVTEPSVVDQSTTESTGQTSTVNEVTNTSESSSITSSRSESNINTTLVSKPDEIVTSTVVSIESETEASTSPVTATIATQTSSVTNATTETSESSAETVTPEPINISEQPNLTLPSTIESISNLLPSSTASSSHASRSPESEPASTVRTTSSPEPEFTSSSSTSSPATSSATTSSSSQSEQLITSTRSPSLPIEPVESYEDSSSSSSSSSTSPERTSSDESTSAGESTAGSAVDESNEHSSNISDHVEPDRSNSPASDAKPPHDPNHSHTPKSGTIETEDIVSNVKRRPTNDDIGDSSNESRSGCDSANRSNDSGCSSEETVVDIASSVNASRLNERLHVHVPHHHHHPPVESVTASGTITSPTTTGIVMLEDNYPTTEDWIAATNLPAEHKESAADELRLAYLRSLSAGKVITLPAD